MGEFEQAGARLRETLSLAEELGDQGYKTSALCGLGEVALAAGNVLAARQFCRRALVIAVEHPRVDASRLVLVSLARLCAHRGERALAVELADLARYIPPDRWREEQHCAEDILSELRSALSSEVYAAAQERGRARDLEATLRELLAELEREASSPIESFRS